MRPALADLVELFVRRGPLLRAFFDAARLDETFEELWDGRIMGMFHLAVAGQIRRQQAAGLVGPEIDPDEMARALNGLDERYLVARLGEPDPKADPGRVLDTLTRIWVGTLYPDHLDAVDPGD